jgi:tetratricopeptide (TPR) repeat protein
LYRISTLFPQSECRDLLLLSINYCIRNLNQGKTQYSHEGLELYKLALDQGFLFEKGEISRFTFRNAVAMGLKIGAFDWVENFILNTQNKLPKLHRDSMVSFNLARLAYEKKDYPQALEHLQKADYQDILLALAAKTLSLKIYYETQELRLLDAAIDSFKIFLRRKKVLAYHRENYQNFLKFLERLIAVNFSNMAKKNALRAAIFAEETLTEKEWFLSKLP